MNGIRKSMSALLLGAALVATGTSTACAVRGEARVRYYDNHHDDWHHWDHYEEEHYRVYLDQRHQQYRNFRSLNDDEKQQYWDWRHRQDGSGAQ